jgi:Ni/Co efflux regulator RcnB
MKRLIIGVVAAASLAGALPAFAQSTVNQREARQQDRIAQGVANGSLTPGEAAHVERREAKVNRTEARMRSHHHGHLTRHERHVLQRRLSYDSRSIHRLKHNDRQY